MVQGLLSAAALSVREIDVVAVGVGPGSFTGIRVAVSVGQGIAFARGVPMVAVTSTLALAEGMRRQHAAEDVTVLIDARRGDAFAARYQWRDGLWQARVDPCVVRLGALPETLTGAGAGVGTAFGNAALAQGTVVAGGVICVDMLPCARDIARIAAGLAGAGQTVPAAQAQPLYLRDKIADTIAERMARLAA